MAEKMFTVNRFLGLHESSDGDTQLKMGEASELVNFKITEDGHLKIRDGVEPVALEYDHLTEYNQEIMGVWSGYVGKEIFLVIATCTPENVKYEADYIYIYRKDVNGTYTGVSSLKNPFEWTTGKVLFFNFGGNLYALCKAGYIKIKKEEAQNTFSPEPVAGYIPLVITAAAPAGGGTTMEPINRLTDLRRIQYSADGSSTAYKLPNEADTVTALSINGKPVTVSTNGSFDSTAHIFTFRTPPAEGINNVGFTYRANPENGSALRAKVLGMRYCETYNGSSDTRLFLYGDGTNVCIYSGVPESGEPSAEYFPDLYEVRVDSNDSPITGMIRHYSRLLVFKPDGTFSISYDALTLADGTVTAGFYVRTINRELGNQAMGQVQQVYNYPRTFANGTIYDWKITSSYYRDERYAKIVSSPVHLTLRGADPDRVVAFDDNRTQEYYLFLNDSQGTVLVHRYLLDAWYIYRSNLFRNVRYVLRWGDDLLFFRYTTMYRFKPERKYDIEESFTTGGEDIQHPISAVWKSGNMAFGADYMRKYSSYIWISMQPEIGSQITVTAETDKRTQYMQKYVGANIFHYGAVDYAHWTYNWSRLPRPHRVKLKVKKFVYYKLVFRVDQPGSKATILGFDQQVRYSSLAK